MGRATLAGGCFWCLEAVFKRIGGVENVIPGYAGGDEKTATYKQVSSGKTAHVEAILFDYDPKVISYEEILEMYWMVHDPTTPGRQANDIGPQYQAVIFYHDDEQKRIAEKTLKKQEKIHGKIATKILPFKTFFEAEEEHFNYYEKNRMNSYCLFVIRPKIKKASGTKWMSLEEK